MTSPLKMDGWKMILSFWDWSLSFRGFHSLLVSGRVIFCEIFGFQSQVVNSRADKKKRGKYGIRGNGLGIFEYTKQNTTKQKQREFVGKKQNLEETFNILLMGNSVFCWWLCLRLLFC